MDGGARQRLTPDAGRYEMLKYSRLLLTAFF